MKYHANQLYHIFNQGNNKEPIFFNNGNYYFFLEKMKRHLLPYVDVVSYCLMPNHFHWLVITKPEACVLCETIKPQPPHNNMDSNYQQVLSKQIGILLRSYTRSINVQEERSGSLFRKRTKVKDGWNGKSLTANSYSHDYIPGAFNLYYARICFRYIHANPVKAGLVKEEIDWTFSSAREYNGLNENGICNKGKANQIFNLEILEWTDHLTWCGDQSTLKLFQ
ncbi:MAG: hypothetical protein AAFO07_27155 [Bacteroidota bacterium]